MNLDEIKAKAKAVVVKYAGWEGATDEAIIKLASRLAAFKYSALALGIVVLALIAFILSKTSC